MESRKLLGVGIVGALVTAVCCFTPLLVVLRIRVALARLSCSSSYGASTPERRGRTAMCALGASHADAVRARLIERMRSHYEGRAKTLCESHPLGIQVNLETGVANGVLVVRTVDDCARLIERIVTRRLELELEESADYTAVREKISRCIFRVMTADAMLTNTFWNFYLDPAE